MAWSNCRSAESLAMIVYQFSVSSLEIWASGFRLLHFFEKFAKISHQDLVLDV